MTDKGINRLAKLMHDRSKQHTEAHDTLVLDFGTIQSNGSLLTNTFPIPIPRSDYLLLNGNQPHSGDHVLVAWVQNDAVIIGVIS